MSTTKKQDKKAELIAVAQKAALSSELAAANIKRYAEVHSGGHEAIYVMKVADAADADLTAAIDAAAKAAINNLQRYLDLKNGG